MRYFMSTSLMICLLLATTSASAQNKVGTTAAAFLGLSTDAKSSAMGNAQVAFAEGTNALYWNPAGLASMTGSGFTISNADWLLDSNFRTVAVAMNSPVGNVGLLISSFNYGEIEVTTINNPEGTGERFEPTDLAVGLSYAKGLTDRFSVGGTVKFVRQKIWNETATGAAVDLGVVYSTSFRNMRIGMSMANFGTDMKLAGTDLREAIDIDPDSEGNNPNLAASLEVDEWPMPLSYRVGIAIDPISSGQSKITVALDALHPNDNSESANAGVQYAYRDLFFLRGGYRHAFTEINNDGGWTVGLGLQYRINDGIGASFDYAFMDYNDLGTQQMWSLTVLF